MTLTEFLLARIAEDEAVAQTATPTRWWYDPTKMNSVDGEESVFTGVRGLRATTVASTGPTDDAQSMADADHIARHDPARVLAECEAKRRIVEGPTRGAMPDTDDWAQVAWDVLCLLALPYADHQDFQEEWRP